MKAPEYVRQVSDAGPARFRQQPVDSDNAVYLASRASERGAQALAAGVARFGAALDKIQEDKDSALLASRVSDFMSAANSANYDPEHGFLHARGEAASGVADRVAKSHKKLAEAAVKGLSPALADRFYRATESFVRSTEASAMRYEEGAMREFRAQEGKRQFDNFCASWALNPELSLDAQTDLIEGIRRNLYGSSGDKDVDFRNFSLVQRSAVTSTAFKMAEQDPVKAQKWLSGFSFLFKDSPDELGSAQQKLEKAALPQKAQLLYSDVGGDYGKGVDWISKNVSPALQESFKVEFAQAYNREEAVKRERYEKKNDELTQLFLDSGGLRGVDLKQLVADGSLDAQSALRWQHTLEAKRNSDLAHAQAMQNRAFSYAYKHASPEDKSYLKLEYATGTTKRQAQAAAAGLLDGLLNGSVNMEDVQSAYDEGQIAKIDFDRLKRADKAKNSHLKNIIDIGNGRIDDVMGAAGVPKELRASAKVVFAERVASGDLNAANSRNALDTIIANTIKGQDGFKEYNWWTFNRVGAAAVVHDLEQGIKKEGSEARLIYDPSSNSIAPNKKLTPKQAPQVNAKPVSNAPAKTAVPAKPAPAANKAQPLQKPAGKPSLDSIFGNL